MGRTRRRHADASRRPEPVRSQGEAVVRSDDPEPR